MLKKIFAAAILTSALALAPMAVWAESAPAEPTPMEHHHHHGDRDHHHHHHHHHDDRGHD